MSERMEAIVDVGAFRCPQWLADGLMCLIELEALKQGRGRMTEQEVYAHCDDWLVGNGFMPLEGKRRKKGMRA